MFYILTSLQLYKRHDAVSSSDNDMYASDAEKLPKEAARPRSMTVDARSTEGDTEEGLDEARDGCVETESEDDNPEATRRYWEMKRKKEGIRKVCYHVP
jgi:hypothetical protein